jgi:lipopolysaccharide/colanic/teichoic acid biosynthesis glycosyltransferase
MSLYGFGVNMYRKFFKRFFDLIISLLVLPFFIILVIIISPIIYFEDKGPVFYNAPRLGKGGKIFKMYKFRSMKVNAPDIRNEDGSTFNSDDDPRLTKIGKFVRKTSIDETPQILNVIKGDMAIVGPRPDLPEFKEFYEEMRILEVKPGVTGYNQAYYRNKVPWKERIQHDIYYIDNMSMRLDINILFMTVLAVLKCKDIYVSSNSKKLNGQFKESM